MVMSNLSLSLRFVCLFLFIHLNSLPDLDFFLLFLLFFAGDYDVLVLLQSAMVD